MSRYFTRAATKSWFEYMPDLTAVETSPLRPQVFEGEPQATGLLDVDGNPIFRGPDRIGYLRKD